MNTDPPLSVLWGRQPSHFPQMQRIFKGFRKECEAERKFRDFLGWIDMRILKEGDKP
jgi:hypothetical protein